MIIDGAEKELYEIIMDIYDEHHLNDINDFTVKLQQNIVNEQFSKLKLFVEIVNDLQEDLGINVEVCFYEA